MRGLLFTPFSAMSCFVFSIGNIPLRTMSWSSVKMNTMFGFDTGLEAAAVEATRNTRSWIADPISSNFLVVCSGSPDAKQRKALNHVTVNSTGLEIPEMDGAKNPIHTYVHIDRQQPQQINRAPVAVTTIMRIVGYQKFFLGMYVHS